MPLPLDHAARMARAQLSLEGLSVGDGFGERFFVAEQVVEMLVRERAVPRAPWRWTRWGATILPTLAPRQGWGRW